MTLNAAQRLIEYGQSAWYDNISRDILFSGELKRLITHCGVRGLTSNPTIFDNALKKGSAYDGQIASLRARKPSVDELFEELALQDIAAAADLLLGVYKESEGVDGFVSIEVSPLLARDAKATVDAARKLFDRLARPNIMIKIPGTPEGLPAIKSALEQGINVNVTLLFSAGNYTQVAKTYCEALRTRLNNGEPISGIRSVASFFVSRVDSTVDSELEKIVKKNGNSAESKLAQSLIGKFGIANCKLAYKEYQSIFLGSQFADLKKAGAKVQRPLWASTSTKNPNYRDVLYVEELIGPDTVNTLPQNTLEAFIDHGVLAETLTKNTGEAELTAAQLTELGLNLEELMKRLQDDGVEKFADS
ncbi:MAG TPA: transaldolase, partial [Oligoflexia bacterium]|nr:transaldolase [Oligoflexia bacterium]